MKCSLVSITFNLPGCTSLKEKRGRMAALRSKFGKQTHIAVCESGHQNSHTKSEWSFVIIGLSGSIIDSTINDIENSIEMLIDAVVEDFYRENL